MWKKLIFLFRSKDGDDKVGGGSSVIAKERLRLVLSHDRSNLPPDILEKMKDDILKVIKNYVMVDEKSLTVQLNSEERDTELVANIPILGVKNEVQKTA